MLFIIIYVCVWCPLLCREIQGMVTVGNILAQMVKNKVKSSDPVTKIMYKQFKMVSACPQLR